MSIAQAIADQIAKCAPATSERVINAMVEREVTKRSDAIVKVLDKLSKAKAESYKIKPDIVSYDEEGKPAVQNWSKDQLEKRKKNAEQILKMERAIDKATDDKKPDMSDVYNLANSGD